MIAQARRITGMMRRRLWRTLDNYGTTEGGAMVLKVARWWPVAHDASPTTIGVPQPLGTFNTDRAVLNAAVQRIARACFR